VSRILRVVFPALLTLLAGGCATLPENDQRSQSTALQDTADTRLGTASQEQESERPGESGFVLLGDGLDAFTARAALALAAERSIDLQYYLYHADLVGHLLTYQLLRAADRGVRVRALIDDMDMGGRDQLLASLDAHPNIEIRLFNPFSRRSQRATQLLTRFGEVTRRMHNKSFTVDNQVTVVGGRNIGNEYFSADPDFAFGDLDVMAVGPVVQQVSGSFDLYWNHELAYPVSGLADGRTKLLSLDELQSRVNDFERANQDSPYVARLRNSSLAIDRGAQTYLAWVGPRPSTIA
jgi:putative cardiolipin synthase